MNRDESMVGVGSKREDVAPIPPPVGSVVVLENIDIEAPLPPLFSSPCCVSSCSPEVQGSCGLLLLSRVLEVLLL